MDGITSAKSMKRLGLLLLACFVGAPLAAAPVLGQVSFRPLTIGHSVMVQKAFGPDDEDCVFETRTVTGADGLGHLNKTLLCND